MSNQPAPTRPWFRLASISRPAPQEPAPALPRSATIRPAFSPPTQAQPNAAAPPPPAGIVSSVPPSPADKKPTVPVNASTSLVPGSPVKTVPTTSPVKPVVTNTTAKLSPAKGAPTTTSVTSSPTRKPASSVTTTSPKSSATTVKPAIQNQIQSPKIKPPTAESEQKMMDKPKGWLFGALQEKGRGKKYSSDSDAGMRIITITGDNKGAFMEINQSAHHKKGFQGSPHRLNRSSSEAGDGKMKSKSNWTKKTPMNAFINSNVQGINNSIVYNSSCASHDPGVHLTLYNS
ncbi:hypothetical protein HRI_001035300 [Hibiscus trionum]|uniref:Uncharacterized protein n=1 Tax=Hibiscus trionum TaxID=183268 RepID=A0A9W7HD75_HIBTR|nr:hypothetical protein HRI_001035300 [Hibiscus trionum]